MSEIDREPAVEQKKSLKESLSDATERWFTSKESTAAAFFKTVAPIAVGVAGGSVLGFGKEDLGWVAVGAGSIGTVGMFYVETLKGMVQGYREADEQRQKRADEAAKPLVVKS